LGCASQVRAPRPSVGRPGKRGSRRCRLNAVVRVVQAQSDQGSEGEIPGGRGATGDQGRGLRSARSRGRTLGAEEEPRLRGGCPPSPRRSACPGRVEAPSTAFEEVEGDRAELPRRFQWRQVSDSSHLSASTIRHGGRQGFCTDHEIAHVVLPGDGEGPHSEAPLKVRILLKRIGCVGLCAAEAPRQASKPSQPPLPRPRRRRARAPAPPTPMPPQAVVRARPPAMRRRTARER
jgi:hypothetical protein